MAICGVLLILLKEGRTEHESWREKKKWVKFSEAILDDNCLWSLITEFQGSKWRTPKSLAAVFWILFPVSSALPKTNYTEQDPERNPKPPTPAGCRRGSAESALFALEGVSEKHAGQKISADEFRHVESCAGSSWTPFHPTGTQFWLNTLLHLQGGPSKLSTLRSPWTPIAFSWIWCFWTRYQFPSFSYTHEDTEFG